jgi:hypothetical protein
VMSFDNAPVMMMYHFPYFFLCMCICLNTVVKKSQQCFKGAKAAASCYKMNAVPTLRKALRRPCY